VKIEDYQIVLGNFKSNVREFVYFLEFMLIFAIFQAKCRVNSFMLIIFI